VSFSFFSYFIYLLVGFLNLSVAGSAVWVDL